MVAGERVMMVGDRWWVEVPSRNVTFQKEKSRLESSGHCWFAPATNSRFQVTLRFVIDISLLRFLAAGLSIIHGFSHKRTAITDLFAFPNKHDRCKTEHQSQKSQ